MWSREERDAYDALLQQVVEEATGTTDRIDLMEWLLADAMQAHQWWAGDADREARRTGYAAQIKSYLKRTRVLFRTAPTVAVSKPRIVGFKRTNDSGNAYDVQALYETATYDQLRDKRAEILRNVRAYDDQLALIDRLLILAELYPDTTSVLEGLAAHGQNLDEYLGQAG